MYYRGKLWRDSWKENDWSEIFWRLYFKYGIESVKHIVLCLRIFEHQQTDFSNAEDFQWQMHGYNDNDID